MLLRQLQECWANKNTVLELDSELLQELTVNTPLSLPDSFAAMGVVSCMPEGMQGFYLQSVSGPSGANLFARFCHSERRPTGCVRDQLRAEETLHSASAVFAEIAHLPEGRVGNVVCRPRCFSQLIRFWRNTGEFLTNKVFRQPPRSDKCQK